MVQKPAREKKRIMALGAVKPQRAASVLRRRCVRGREGLRVRGARSATAIPAPFSKVSPCGGRALVSGVVEEDKETSLGGVLLPKSSSSEGENAPRVGKVLDLHKEDMGDAPSPKLHFSVGDDVAYRYDIFSLSLSLFMNFGSHQKKKKKKRRSSKSEPSLSTRRRTKERTHRGVHHVHAHCKRYITSLPLIRITMNSLASDRDAKEEEEEEECCSGLISH